MTPELQSILLRRLEAGSSEFKRIDQELWNTYGRDLTILISDMSGFSRMTREHGIIHFLSMIAKQREIVAPLIEKNGGRLIKAEADNLFIAFDGAADAVRASRAVHAELREFNGSRPESSHIIACHGIATGHVLDLGDDMYGNAVNMASKLGEDLANDYDTLVTVEARAACGDEFQFEENHAVISGVDLIYYRAL